MKKIGYILTLGVLVWGIVAFFPTDSRPVQGAGETITGFIFEDSNNNATYDTELDGKVQGVTVRLVDVTSGPVFIGTTLTDSSGIYTFNVTSGSTYQIDIIGYPWINTLVTFGSTSFTVGPIGLGKQAHPPAIGIFHQATVSGRVFFDADEDDVVSSGDGIVPFGTVSAYDESDDLVAGPVSVDHLGNYNLAITVPDAGNYELSFSALPQNYSFVEANVGNNESIDSDVDESGHTIPLELVYGQELPDISAGVYQRHLRVGNLVWNDENHNGIREVSSMGTLEDPVEDENTLANVPVTLRDLISNTSLAETQSDSGGNYILDAAATGCIGPNYHWLTEDSWATPPEALDCAVTQLGGSYYLTYTTSADCDGSNAGEITLLSASGGVLYNASCGNGMSDLHGNTSYAVGPFFEDDDGTAQLLFDPHGGNTMIGNVFLSYGLQRVEFAAPSGFGVTIESELEFGEEYDSDIDNFGYSDDLVLQAGVYQDIDSGFYANEANLILDLFENSNPSATSMTTGSGAELTFTVTVTNTGPGMANNVQVSFPISASELDLVNAQVNSGTYDSFTGGWTISSLGVNHTATLVVTTQAVDDGMTTLTAEILSAATSDPDSTFGDHTDQDDYKTFAVTVLSEAATASIGDYVWLDENQNGLQDGDEFGLGNVRVELRDLDDNELIQTTVTENQGAYRFDNVLAGFYRLRFVKPADFSFTDDQIGDDQAVDSDVINSDGFTYFFQIQTGEQRSDLDAGFFTDTAYCFPGVDVCIGDRVFFDTNNNGIQDEGESGFTGVFVEIYNQTTGELVSTTVSHGNGGYLFSTSSSGLTDGVPYYVKFYLPSGYEFSPQNAVNSTEINDSDPDYNTGLTTTITLSSQEVNDELDAGLHQTNATNYCVSVDCGTLHLHFFKDSNANGVEDNGEVSGTGDRLVSVLLENSSESYELVELVDSVGNINVMVPTNLGEYTLHIIPMDDFSISGSSDQYPDSDLYTNIQLEDNQTLDLGARGIYNGDSLCDGPCGFIRFRIFTDLNGDGVFNGDDFGSANNVSITIVNLGDDDRTFTVDEFPEDGQIEGDLAPGNYSMTFNVPSGYEVTANDSVDEDNINPVYFTIYGDQTTDIGDRGIHEIEASSGSGSSHGGGGGGGGGRSHSSSNNSSSGSWSKGFLSSDRARGQNSNTSTATTADNTSNCLVINGAVPLSFSDTGSLTDTTNFLTSITFKNANQNRLVQGYGNGMFGTANKLTRFELLKIALNSNCLANGQLTRPNTYFSDVPKDNSELSLIVGEAYARGIVQGQGGKFFPSNPVTYGEMVKMIVGSSVYFKDGKPLSTLDITISGITDLSFAQTAEYAKRLNILPTFSDNLYPQNKQVIRAEVATLLRSYIEAMLGTLIAA